MLDIKFVIPLIPVTKKNSQQIYVNKKTGRPFICPSEKYKNFSRDAKLFMPHVQTIISPVNVKYYFYMPTERRVDALNLSAAMDDILVENGVLLDDNAKIVVSHDGTRVFVDHDNPRIEVCITTERATFYK